VALGLGPIFLSQRCGLLGATEGIGSNAGAVLGPGVVGAKNRSADAEQWTPANSEKSKGMALCACHITSNPSGY
jgi:hypothetical protein